MKKIDISVTPFELEILQSAIRTAIQSYKDDIIDWRKNSYEMRDDESLHLEEIKRLKELGRNKFQMKFEDE